MNPSWLCYWSELCREPQSNCNYC